MRQFLPILFSVSLALNAPSFASDEINFETDPIVTVDIEQGSNPQQFHTLFLWIGTTLLFVTATATWLCLKK